MLGGADTKMIFPLTMSDGALLYWREFKYEFIGFASSSFTLISVNSKAF